MCSRCRFASGDIDGDSIIGGFPSETEDTPGMFEVSCGGTASSCTDTVSTSATDGTDAESSSATDETTANPRGVTSSGSDTLLPTVRSPYTGDYGYVTLLVLCLLLENVTYVGSNLVSRILNVLSAAQNGVGRYHELQARRLTFCRSHCSTPPCISVFEAIDDH